MYMRILKTSFALLVSGLLLAGCTGLTTIGQAISAAQPNAVTPTITLVCENALCARAAHPVSARKNSNGAYMVLPARPMIYVEATYPDLLGLTVAVNGTNLQLLSGGSLDQCHPAGCAFYTTLSIPPVPPSTQPTHMTKAKISIIPPDAMARQEKLAVAIGTRNSTQSANAQFDIAVERPGTPTNVSAFYSPTTGGVGGIDVEWTAPANSVVDYYIVSRNDGRNASFYGDPSREVYVDTSIAHSPGTWSYQVKAVNISGESSESNVATATVPQSGGNNGGTTKTCDNKTPASSATNFTIAVENPTTRCVTNIVAVFANNQSDAQNCVKSAAVPNAVIGQGSQLKQYFFSIYQADGTGGYYCQTANDPALSASDANSCVSKTVCSNCTVHDITNQVYGNGQISASYASWCTDHPNP
jgi:hypothetical protein